MSSFQPKDVIAILLISGLILFKMTGHDGTFDPAVALVLGYYFVKRENGQDKGV